ncbi:MAG TPA: hypothetical protein VH853_06665 [Polyangia bacterium]|jgi:hypothetical protein|nr:hypothetical protein [Polyangia bacterium]
MVTGLRDHQSYSSGNEATEWAFARPAIAFLGLVGAAWTIPPRELPGASPALVFALKLLAIGCLVVAALLERGDSGSGRFEPGDALARHWLLFAPPAVLLFLPEETARSVRLPVLLGSAILAVLGDRASAAEASPREKPPGPWSRALLVAGICIGVAYVVVGATATGSTDNDPAYYYGVARHIFLTHRYEEPIVWHFLVKPPQVLHRPFDYWSGLTSISLLPFFWLFGASHRTAGAAMGIVSGLSVVAFAHLVGTAAPLRSRVVQVVALLLYAFSPALMRFRFDVETIPFVHLWMILSLIALVRRRPEQAVIFAFLMFWSRPEDVVLAAIISALAVAFAFRQAPPRSRRTLLTGALCGAVYLLYNLAVLGTPLPAGAAVGRRLTDYMALYRWTEAPPATWTLEEHWLPDYFASRLHVALSNLQEVTFFLNYPVWIALAAIRGCCWPRGRSNVEGVSWLLLFAGAVTISWVNPTMFAWQRTLQALLPVFVLAGAYGAEALFEALDRVPASRFPRAFPAWVIRPLPALLLALVMIHPLEMSLAPGAPLSFSADIAALDATLDGRTVLSPRPWSVIAETRSPAVFVPENGEAAMEAVIRRYDVRWLLLIGDECLGASQAICRELVSGARRKVGGATLTKRLTRGDVTLFEVALST